MILFLLNTEDQAGLRLARTLHNRGVNDLVLVSAEELMYAPVFCCGIREGQAFFQIELRNGIILNEATVRTTLNRISYLPQQHLKYFRPADRPYVEGELHAVFTFLLSILPNPLFNSTSGMGLSGQSRPDLQWRHLARKADLETEACIYEQGRLQQVTHPAMLPEKEVLFFRGKCFGNNLSADLAERCAVLGNLSGERILGFRFLQTKGGYLFKEAQTVPSFETVPERFLNELITHF